MFAFFGKLKKIISLGGYQMLGLPL